MVPNVGIIATMKLHDWLDAEKIGDATFAEMIGGVSEHAVRKWRYRERMPRVEELRRIFSITNGAVTPNDFVGIASLPTTPEPAQ